MNKILNKIVNGYNTSMHRGIGITPQESMEERNWPIVIEATQKYRKEFLYKELPKIEVGKTVYVRNEVRTSKDERRYKEKGKVVENSNRDTYKVLLENGNIVLRHYSQLKGFPGML